MNLDGLRRLGQRKKKGVPGGLWIRCRDCHSTVYKKQVEDGLNVCPQCNYHFEISSRDRIALLMDDGSFEEVLQELSPLDPLEFVGKRPYKDRLAGSQKKTGLKDACVIGTGTIGGYDVVFGVTDSSFMRGSMGSVVGEKIARGVELAMAKSVPFVFVSGSGGGARMDEGVLSLYQMAKTSAALAKFNEENGFYISILTNPTMGGAMASFAALGDIIVAEPKALLGFAGPGVIKTTIKEDIPAGFQRSEFLLEHGFVDMVVNRPDLKETITRLLAYAGE